uniref:Uncharacterized protein n=1 Tax=Arundo donax TaxID=35708 RepID=A0A0A9A6Z9_ARUDO
MRIAKLIYLGSRRNCYVIKF